MLGSIFSSLQAFIIYLMTFISNVAMLILLIRFVAAPFMYFDAGPIVQSINSAAMLMCSPFRKIAWWIGFRRRDISPVLAILAILILRGLLYTLIPASFAGNTQLNALLFIAGQQFSFSMGALSLLKVAALLLFASVMFAKAGGLYSGMFFKTVDSIAANVFTVVRKVIHVKNLWGLLVISSIAISAIYGLAISLIMLNIRFPYFWAGGFLAIAGMVLWVMMILALAYIIVSWLVAFSPGGTGWRQMVAAAASDGSPTTGYVQEDVSMAQDRDVGSLPAVVFSGTITMPESGCSNACGTDENVKSM